MSRIIYGVSGEGSGHSSRARVMLTHLRSLGHEVRVLSYDRGYKNLKPDFDVFHIAGLHIVSRDNKVAPLDTLARNLKALPDGRKSLSNTRRLFEAFEPDAVITDFEPTSAYLARHYRLPLVSIDNQHRMRYMKTPRVPGAGKDALLTKGIIRAMVPRPSVALVTTFFFGEVRNRRTFLFPPILRQAVLDLEPRTGEHILVYATQSFDSLLETLRGFGGQRFTVYGYDKEQQEANLHFRPFSKDGFLQDLASSAGVIATAGFTLMTEALHLGKPMLALPMQGQFEQMLNGHLLTDLGYGISHDTPSAEAVDSFLGALASYRTALAAYSREGNVKIKAKLAELFADDNKLLRQLDALR